MTFSAWHSRRASIARFKAHGKFVCESGHFYCKKNELVRKTSSDLAPYINTIGLVLSVFPTANFRDIVLFHERFIHAIAGVVPLIPPKS